MDQNQGDLTWWATPSKKVSVDRVQFSEWDASEQDDGTVAPSCSWIPPSTPFHDAPFNESSCAAMKQKQGFNSFL